MVQLEKAGIPTVSLTARHFERGARATGEVMGLAGIPLAIVEETFTSHSDGQITAMVAIAIEAIEKSFTMAPPDVSVRRSAGAERDSFEGEDLLECAERYNRAAIECGWSDGLPLVPPTPRAVERMLAACPLAPATVIADALYPGLGIATLEKIAINGVMAGCRPEHMAVLVALVRAYTGTGAMGKTQAMSTGPNAPLVMVSGPIVERLGFNNSTCALGPGSVSHVNTVVGRALRLILMNIGQAYPGRMDMDTIGTANKYSFCVAENAAKSPWEPWNVRHGYDAQTSTLSIALVYPGPDVLDWTSTTPQGFLDTLASLTAHYQGTASIGRWLYGGRAEPESGRKIYERNVILLAPEHARIMKEHGWSPADVGNYLYRASRMPFKDLYTPMVRDKDETLRKAYPDMMWLLDSPDALVPTAEHPDCYECFVVGGEAGRSQYLFGGSEISTVSIDEWPAE